METQTLGETGREVSRLAFGTVELGLDYGIPAPGRFERPSTSKALRLLDAAVKSGVTLYDTAPGYGASEELIGAAFGDHTDVCIATKVRPEEPKDVAEQVRASVEQSATRLRRSKIDLIQIHNATREEVVGGPLIETLETLKREGTVGLIGASIYDVEVGIAAVEAETVDVLQVPINALDRRPTRSLLPAAQEAGVGVIARSVLLKGALTKSVEHLPSRLSPIREAVRQLVQALGASLEALPVLAIRYILSIDEVDTVLLGMRERSELETAVQAIEQGPLSPEQLERIRKISIPDRALLDPSTWGPLEES